MDIPKPSRPRFKEHVYLAPFLDHLDHIRYRIPVDEQVIVYRTQHVIPVDEYGETPNPLRDPKGMGRRVRRRFTE